jgi:hypothetical protein
MRIGTMLSKRLVVGWISKTDARAPTNMRRMLPGPRIEPTNRTTCEEKGVSAFSFFLKKSYTVTRNV